MTRMTEMTAKLENSKGKRKLKINLKYFLILFIKLEKTLSLRHSVILNLFYYFFEMLTA